MRYRAWLGGAGSSLLLALALAGAGTGCDDTGAAPEVGAARSALSAQDKNALYVGDNADDAVKRYDPVNETFVPFASPTPPGCSTAGSPSGCLDGPRGMFFAHGKLYVVSQRPSAVDPSTPHSEVLRYQAEHGSFSDTLVPGNQDAPYDGRAAVLGPHNILYVVDYNDDGVSPAGRITRFQASTGQFLGDLDPTGFNGNFRPTSIVFGCDGLLYVTTSNLFGPVNPSPLGGYVLRFDPETGKFKDIFVESDPADDQHYDDVGRLNRPFGLVFGPDRNLYVISYPNTAPVEGDPLNTDNTDSIIVYDGHTGEFRYRIALNEPTLLPPPAPAPARAPAQALVFGPGGQLFITVLFDNPAPLPDFHEVRAYDVNSPGHPYHVLPDPGSSLMTPRYLIFGRSDPMTLSYGQGCTGH